MTEHFAFGAVGRIVQALAEQIVVAQDEDRERRRVGLRGRCGLPMLIWLRQGVAAMTQFGG